MNSLASSLRHSSGGFRPDIEGLRGIAVLLVVLFHSGVPGFRGGYVGVDVFFVLSGYLITGLIVAEIEKTSVFSFRNFYARRVRRLLPASGLMVVGVLLAGRILYSPLELARYANWGTYTSLYFSNYMFIASASDYFAGKVTNNPFLHTWSLAVEEQFYLFWPALIALFFLRSQSRRKLAWSLLGLTVISLAASVWVTHIREPWAFFSLPTRAWEFGAGGLAILLRRKVFSGREKWMKPMSWAGFAALCVAGHFFYRVKPAFPGYVAVLPVAGTLAMLLEGAAGTPSIMQRILAWPLMQRLGTLSYSWYLWHWPFLIFAEAYNPRLSWKGRLMVAVGALLVAQLTHWVVENPVRFHPRLVANPWLSLGLAVVVPAVGVTVALVMNHEAAGDLFAGKQQEIYVAATDIGPWHDCIVPQGESRVEECVFGDKGSSTTVVLLGDSHAGQWYAPMNSIAEKKHWKLITLLKANCQVAALATQSDGHARDGVCKEWRDKALQRVSALRPALVVLGESAASVANPRMNERPVTPQEWGDGLHSKLSTLGTNGTKVLVMADIPYATYDVPVCLSRLVAGRRGTKSCVIARKTGTNDRVRHAEMAAVSGNTNARWVDITDLFCSEVQCLTVIDNLVAYRDDNHVSEALALHLAPRLEREIDLLMNPTSVSSNLSSYTNGNAGAGAKLGEGIL